MGLLVQKFGGTAVGDPERIRAVADHIERTVKSGQQVVVVVSAMGKETDELLRLAEDVSSKRPGREMDMLITAGERKAMSLLCMALHDLGVNADSFTGSQAGFLTDTNHQNAKILEVKPERIREALSEGKVPVVGGSQGVSVENDVTFLGRGGSDATAVALAAALGAERCEIFTDVEGVFTADPRVVSSAELIPEITYEEMLEMASSGAGVLMARSVEFGRRYNVPIIVKSTFTNNEGTEVKEKVMEEALVSGVTHNTKEVKFTLFEVPDQPGIAGTVFGSLSEIGINVDMIVQNVSKDSITDISFTAPTEQKDAVEDMLKNIAIELKAKGYDVDENVGRVSIIGAGMKSESGVASKMFKILGENSINISMISTSPIRVSCVIDSKDINAALEALHKEFIEKE